MSDNVKIAYVVCKTIFNLSLMGMAMAAPVFFTPGYYWWTAFFLLILLFPQKKQP